MSNNRALVPVLASLGAAAVGVVVYAFSGRRQSAAPPAPNLDAEPLRESMVVPRADERDFDWDEPTVQADIKVPALAGADDAEPPGPDDLGSYWLSRATQSERSLTELDLKPEVEAIADPRAALDEPELDDEDEAQDRALAAAEAEQTADGRR
ncbi:MAG: hypothetical protein ABUL62_23715 [Myxococcales bacterium]